MNMKIFRITLEVSNLEERLNAFIPCHGAVVQFSVLPPIATTPYGEYPYILDVQPKEPIGGIEASGWRLVYGPAKPELVRAAEEESEIYDFQHSLGIFVKGDGTSGDAGDGIVRDAVPGMPAALAGVGPAMRLVAVNGRRYSEKGLRDALREAHEGTAPIELLLENVDTFSTVRVDYHGGERYPRLDRDASKPDLLTQIGAPRAGK